MDIDKAVEYLLKKIQNAHDSADAMRFSQALLNITHAKATDHAVEKDLPE